MRRKNSMEVGGRTLRRVKEELDSPPVDQKVLEKKSAIERKMEELAAELEKQHATSNSIKRQGNELILPTYMSDADAVSMLQRRMKEMGEKQKKVIVIEGHPDDCLWNFAHAMEETFGHVMGAGSQVHFFGMSIDVPGETRTVKTGYDTQETVPYGNIEIPGLPVQLKIGFESDAIPGKLYIMAEYVKKFQPIVEEIERRVLERMKTHSIFRGQALNSRWEFINLKGFPLERISYEAAEKTSLHANLFRMLESTEAVKKMGVSLKRTILLHGRFGTGKTLTALKTANIAVQHGWTFINVVPGDDIVKALQIAKLYGRCVVFFEDIDHDTSGGRDTRLNEILNTVDGLLSKSSEIVVVLTTNNVGQIDPSMMRPGRIDKIIELGRIDAAMMKQMIEGYVGEGLQGELDMLTLLEAAKDYTPAFVAEACNGAMLYALDRTDGQDTRITSGDIESSLRGLRSQYELMTASREKRVTLDEHLQLMLANAVKEKENGKMTVTVEMLEGASAGRYKEFAKEIRAAAKK
jgi:transitional endoplasmic reticulum ATPase